MRDDPRLFLLLGLGALGAWLWFTRSGQAFAQSVGASIGKGAFAVTEEFANLTRGERNNNPGNIEKSGSPWHGKIVPGKDDRFETFSDPVYGIRALAKTLRTYYATHGLRSVSQMIARWAPGHENPTDAYVAHVARAAGVSPTETLRALDPVTLFDISKAIIQFENGRVKYSDSTIAEGVRRAFT